MKKVIFLFAVVFIFSCTWVQRQDENTASSAANDTFPAAGNSFAEYQSAVARYLNKRSLQQRSVDDIALNLPFEMSADREVAYQGKFLLFHGLNDSPFVWRDFAREMSQRGFDVRAVLLPGHGSHPREMLNISYQQWLDTARSHYRAWKVDDTAIYIGGFSMGAVLATSLALEFPDVAGLVLVSPAYHSKLNNLLRFSWLYKKFKPWMFGGLITEDNPTKYNSIAINGGTQYYNLTRYLKSQWGESTLNIPVLMVLTMDDSVVDVGYSREVFQRRFTAERKKLLLYSSDAADLLTVQSNEALRPSKFLEQRILNQSHLSLMNSSLNPLLGKGGSQLICNGNEYPVFIACMNAKGHWFGAQHTPSPDGIAVARTSYNPDFPELINAFEEVFLY